MNDFNNTPPVNLSCSYDAEQVLLNFNEHCLVRLTPSQARALATQIISAVNRAEARDRAGRAQIFQRSEPYRAASAPSFTPRFAE